MFLHSRISRILWKELIVNVATHRDYSIAGTDIQIKMFDDRFIIDSKAHSQVL